MAAQERCLATTKAGNPCKNKSQEGSAYCYTHRASAADKAVEPVERLDMEEDEMTEATESSNSNAAELQEIQEMLNDLNETVNQMRERITETPPAVVMLEATRQWMAENFDKYTPDVIKSIRDVLEDATAEDLKDPETWRGIWTIITHSLQQDSMELYERIKSQLEESESVKSSMAYIDELPTIRESREQFQAIPAVKRTTEILENLPGYQSSVSFLNSLPGSSIVATLGQAIDDATPKDFLEQDTWSGIWYMVSHAMQTEWEEMKARVTDDDADSEDEIIDITDG